MPYMHNPKLTENAKKLRKNMTEEERKLWYMFLRNHSPKFYRQKVIDDYIVDFYCREAKLVIEIDGSQHYEEAGMLKDRIRTERIEKHDLLVIRIPNTEINRNISGVCDYIDQVIEERTEPFSQPYG